MEQQPEHDSSWNKLTSTEQTKSILGMLITIAVIMAALSWLAKDDLTLADFGVNLSTELFGAAITFYFLNLILGQTIEKEQKDQADSLSKRKLIQRLKNSNEIIVADAIEELSVLGWLNNGYLNYSDFDYANFHRAKIHWATLQGVRFYRANLDGSHLSMVKIQNGRFLRATLRGAMLHNVDLDDSDLTEANLSSVTMMFCSLKRAWLFGTNLQDARISAVFLQDAILIGCDLTGATVFGINLTNVDLKNAILVDTHFDEKTILPDGTTWTPETDMSRFTDPNHPEFWRSDDPNSPAYQGKT